MATITDKEMQAYSDMLNMIEDRGYDVEQAAEAIQPWYDFTIAELVALYTKG